MQNTEPDLATDTFGHAEISHPYYEDCTLSHAVKLARNIARLSGAKIGSLAEAKTVIERSNQNCGHTWMTGDAALDPNARQTSGFSPRKESANAL